MALASDHISIALASGCALRVPTRFGGYEYVRTLGEGASSAVILVRDTASRALLACKVVSRAFLASAAIFERFEQEVRLLPLLAHPHIVRFERIVYGPELIFVLMEYCAGGDLFAHIVRAGILPEHEARELFAQILSAVRFIHARGIAHRDLKPENVLLDDARRAKLGDFGLCRVIPAQPLLTTPCGSPLYAPPEVLAKRPYDGRRADVWSLGVMLFAMVTGSLPWSTANQVALFREIAEKRIEIPTTLSPTLQAVLDGMLRRNPDERMTVEQLIDAPWCTVPSKKMCRHAMTMSSVTLVPGAPRSRRLVGRRRARGEKPAVASVPALLPAMRNTKFRRSLLWS
jgi:serine/threonine protein kinase